MTIELILCAMAMLLTLPLSKAIGLHYMAFFGVNLFFLGYEFADASLLSMVFAFLAIIDTLLAVHGGRSILFVSASASLALSLESVGNGDWLLNHSNYLSIATNAVILGSLFREYGIWMRGRLGL